jgi:HlyD family secretion protein
LTPMSDKSQLSVNATMTQVAAAGRRKRLMRWGAALAAALVLTIVIVAWSLGSRSGAVSYQTQPVRRGDLAITVVATGALQATNQVQVGSELSGIIVSLKADYNDAVKVGQPLAYLDDSKYRAAVARSRAELAAAKANHKETLATRQAQEKKLARQRKTRELTENKLPSQEDLEQTEADLERAMAAVDAAAAAIDKALATLNSDETDLKKTVIYSPINGIVLSRDVEVGQTVAASLQAPVLFTLAEDLRHMELQVDVDEADVGQIQAGQSAEFTVDAYPDRNFEAQIIQVRYGAQTTEGVVTYKSVLRVENPELLLRPGMTATATIAVLTIEKTLLVPSAALRFAPAQPSQKAKRQGGLVGALMPRPRFSRANRPAGEEDLEKSKPAQVWILKENQPAAVAVKVDASDGAITAVTSPDLKEGLAVIVYAVTPKE